MKESHRRNIAAAVRKRCTKHGHAVRGHTSPELMAWQAMKRRCYNPASISYPNYGGRGIRMCLRWRNSFLAFLADMGTRPSPDHSIDRIDNEGSYNPKNCRWATRKEQNSNKRKYKTARWLTYQGRTQTLTDWAKEVGLSRNALTNRINSGWSVEDALYSPKDYGKRRKP